MKIQHGHGPFISRRASLAAFGCLCGAAVASPLMGGPAHGQARPAKMAPGTIDVHSHAFPPNLEVVNAQALAALSVAPLVKWSPAAALEAMDRTGVAKSVLSISWRPSMLELQGEQLRGLARGANDYVARLGQEHRSRFSQWVFLPMPDVEGALAEIAYGLDVLKAPGVGLMTSYGPRWIGDPSFRPVLEELNRRKAVAFCHPLPAACCTALMPGVSTAEANLIEFPYDTGRGMVSLLMSGAFARYPDIRWIFCHCGGPLPALSGRVRMKVASMPAEEVAKFAPRGVDYEFRRQFYDTADAAYGPPMAALRAYVPDSQILFGTDFPYVLMDSNVSDIHERRLPDATMAGIQRSNVLRLLPQLA